jgi:DNA (cytosine-5)-methyltransferase 1
MNYYNEIDPYAAQWLRNLIAAGAIPPGYVDERSIADVRPADLSEFTQCHFFAGIGGWSLALKIAGVDPSTPIWTGSCPCQPFSAAGKRKGTEDERHLWPVFRDLIAQCQPPVVLGEQVASADGRAWLSTVRTDLEALGYAAAGADLCAAGVGAPHIRQRIYFVGLADTNHQRLERAERQGIQDDQQGRADHGSVGGLADTDDEGPQGRGLLPERADQCTAGEGSVEHGGRTGTPYSFWSDADWLYCRDGKWRPVESGSQPLAHGIPARVGRLRGYGNAIVPQVAAVFIRAVMQAKRKTD